VIVLIDGDLVTYPCAASAENDPLEIAIARADNEVRRILYELGAEDYSLYIRGDDRNFRFGVYDLYKANRAGKPAPRHLEPLREFLIKSWKAEVVMGGIETDDRLGIEQTRYGLESCIASYDKDLLQIPGWHFNFRHSQRTFVSPFDALRNFYKQVIAGDGADNIPGFDGKVRNQVPKFIQKLQEPLEDMTDETDMLSHVWDIWEDDYKNIDRNSKLLYILREEGIHWQDKGNPNPNSSPPWNTEPQSSSQDQSDTKQ
jgi:hypothetical protein